jgi:hypothetical protein
MTRDEMHLDAMLRHLGAPYYTRSTDVRPRPASTGPST